MGISLNQIVKPQSDLLNQRAIIFSDEQSANKRLYVEGRKPKFTLSDVKYLLRKFKEIYKLPSTLIKTTNLIKSNQIEVKRYITSNDVQQLKMLLGALHVESYGFFEVTSDKVFKGYGVPYKYALVLSIPMNPDLFKSAPSIECQVEVARVYSKSGDAANRVADFLQRLGYGASPNHSMGGQLDYSMASEWAGLGVVGRHSMAITQKSGACHRISIVYVSIENLNEYITEDNHEMQWIKSFCEKCGKCIRKCPTGAILKYPVIKEGNKPTRIEYESCCKGFVSYGCGVCIKECPFTTSGYEKIKAAFENQKKS